MRASFQESDLTTNGLRALLATALGVPVANVTAATSSVTYQTIASTIVTMSVNATPAMRFILFATPRSSVQQSNDEVLAYIKQNAAAWGDGLAITRFTTLIAWDILPTLEPQSIDAVICDPPYGTTACRRSGTRSSLLRRCGRASSACYARAGRAYCSGRSRSRARW